MTTSAGRTRELRELMIQAGLLALAAVGYFAVPPGIGRAVLVLPALVWIPGRCLVVRLGLHRTAGFWAVPLSVLLSFVGLIAAALLEYAVFRHIDFGPLPLWVSLAALVLTAWRRYGDDEQNAVPDHGRATSALRTGAVFCAGTAASAAVLAGAYHLLPTQQQPGYLQFAYAGQYAALTGVVGATPGEHLTIGFTVTATEENTSGLTVVAQLDGRPVGSPAPVTLAPDEAVHGVSGHATLGVDVPAGCLNRYTFTLEQNRTALRMLDLYVTTAQTTAHCPSS